MGRAARTEDGALLILSVERGVVFFRARELLGMHDLLVHGLAGGGEERQLCLGALALQDVDRRDRARAPLVHHHALGDGPVDAPGLAALLGGRHILEAVIDGRLRDVELLLGLPAVLLALAAEGTLALAAGPAAAALLAELAAAFRAALAWRTVGTLAAVPAVAALAGASVPRRPVAPLPPRRATLALRTLRGVGGRGLGAGRCRAGRHAARGGFSPAAPAPATTRLLARGRRARCLRGGCRGLGRRARGISCRRCALG